MCQSDSVVQTGRVILPTYLCHFSCRQSVREDCVRSLIAELRRANGGQRGTMGKKIGNPSSRENLVMTSPYERTAVRTDYGGGEGSLAVTLTGERKNFILY